MRAVLLAIAVLTLSACPGPSYEEQALEAHAAGDFTLAADMYTMAAGEAVCPARAEFLTSLAAPILRKPVGLADLRAVLGTAKR